MVDDDTDRQILRTMGQAGSAYFDAALLQKETGLPVAMLEEHLRRLERRELVQRLRGDTGAPSYCLTGSGEAQAKALADTTG